MAITLKRGGGTTAPNFPIQAAIAEASNAIDLQALKDAGFDVLQDSVITPPQEKLTARQKQALIDAGLMKAPAPIKKGVTIKHYRSFSKGDKVTITNDLFPWMEWWKPGDTGVVTRTWEAVPEAKNDEKRKYGICEVQLDKARVKDRGVLLFHCWELGLAP